jgi:hypothetical protein
MSNKIAFNTMWVIALGYLHYKFAVVADDGRSNSEVKLA